MSATGTVKLGVDNALSTVSALQFGAASNSGTVGSLDMNGKSQTVASLASITTSAITGIKNATANPLSTLTIQGSATTTYAGPIGATGANNVALTLLSTNNGTLTLSGTNTYTGNTTISGGTLKVDSAGSTTPRLAGTTGIAVNNGGTLLLANSVTGTPSNDRINNSATMTLNGGTFDTGGLSEHGVSNNTAGIGALTLQSSSIIDMGSAASIIAFTNSNAQTWTGTLSIYNWSGNAYSGGGTDQLFFGSDGTGLNSAQLGDIVFYSNAGITQIGFGPAAILSTGEVVPSPSRPLGWLALWPSARSATASAVGWAGCWTRGALCARRPEEFARPHAGLFRCPKREFELWHDATTRLLVRRETDRGRLTSFAVILVA